MRKLSNYIVENNEAPDRDDIIAELREAFESEIPEIEPYSLYDYEDGWIYFRNGDNYRNEITLIYDKRRRSLTVNVSSLGSVDINEPSKEKDYYMAVGAFFANADTVTEIIERIVVPYEQGQ